MRWRVVVGSYIPIIMRWRMVVGSYLPIIMRWRVVVGRHTSRSLSDTWLASSHTTVTTSA